MDIQQILTGAQEAMTVRRVFGEPMQVDGVTMVPAAVVGGGGGGGTRIPESGGAGFGISARPAGVFVVRNGDVAWRPAVDVNRVILGGQMVAIAAMWLLRPVAMRWLSRGGQASA